MDSGNAPPANTPDRDRHTVRVGAWLLDAEALHREFVALWAAFDPVGHVGPASGSGPAPAHEALDHLRFGNTWALRARALELWSSTEPVVIDHIGRLELSTPDEWTTGFADAHLGHWYRLCLSAYLTPVAPLHHYEELKAGLPLLGWSPVETRRLLRGRELGELAETWGADSYGPAVALSLGHGHRGWLGADDIAAAQERLSELDRDQFRHRPDLVPLCEELWDLLDTAAGNADQVLVVATNP